MQSFNATDVDAADAMSLEHGEGWLSFSWADPMYGSEGLTIDVYDGHCSRRMPIRSGYGLSGIALQRDRIHLSFAPGLAKKLQLDERIEILFQISDADFIRLQQAVANYLN